MTLTEMFNICDTCVYAPCFCGNAPENCIAYVRRNGKSEEIQANSQKDKENG